MPTVTDLKLAVDSQLAEWIPRALHTAAIELANASLRNTAVDRLHTAEVLAVLQGQAKAFGALWLRHLKEGLDEADSDADPQAQGGAPALIAEEQIDEDIETARVVRAIETVAEAELRQLASLCSSLRGMTAVTTEAVVLHPTLCARALCRSLDDLALPTRTARLLMLYHVGTALSRQLRQVYASHCELLTRWGVRPAQPVSASSESRVASVAPPALMTQDQPTGSLARLVQWAQQRVDAAPPASETGRPPALRLLRDPLPTGTKAPGLGAGAAIRVMEQLFEQLLRQSSLSPAGRDWVQRLQAPGRELAASEADLWASLDHPWWQLLDRLIALGAVHDETDLAPAGTATVSLGRVIDGLRQATAIDRRACETAVAEVDQVTRRLVQDRHGRLGTTVSAVQSLADREQVEIALRNQVVQQLRQTPAPLGLRQFLVGPWVLAMSEVALRHGTKSEELHALATLVDDLVNACSHPFRPVRAERQQALLRRAGTGLAATALAPARLDAELGDLAAVLSNPVHGDDDDMPNGPFLDGNAGVPTVLIDMLETGESSEAARDCQAWLDTLAPGTYCRMFLMGRWMTTQLSWVSSNRNLYVFSSRYAGRVHSMTRRALEKARGAGLAATVGQGGWLAQAMDTLTDEGQALEPVSVKSYAESR